MVARGLSAADSMHPDVVYQHVVNVCFMIFVHECVEDALGPRSNPAGAIWTVSLTRFFPARNWIFFLYSFP
jgi:hypothetical protein